MIPYYLQYNSINNGQRDSDISNSISQLRVVHPPAVVSPTSDPLLPETVGHALKSVAQATNISADALLASIQLRQQQVLYQQQKQLAALAAAATSTTSTTITTTPSTTTTTAATTSATTTAISNIAYKMTPATSYITTTSNPFLQAGQPSFEYTTSRGANAAINRHKYALAGIHKVMNAPKEYYPVNYDKNFDDNFTSRVELPDTSFSCGDQKHFPGLYADEDLNCMVHIRFLFLFL